MRHILEVRGVGAALGAAGVLWVAAAFAQDAGVDAGGSDAGAPNAPGSIPAGALVYPPAGATGVVLNAGLILRLEQTILEPSIDAPVSPDPPALGEVLLLRDDSGRLIAAGKTATVETPRPYWAAQALANSQVEIATGPLTLSPQTHYQVLSRVAVCPPDGGGEGGVRIACLQEEFVEISDFTTGTEVDRQGPMIASVDQGASPGSCLAELSVVASDDHVPPSALRFASDAVAFLGPNLVLPTPAPTNSGGRATLLVVPIDPSNNRGPGREVDVEACLRLVGEDGFNDSQPPLASPTAPALVAGTPGSSGCAVASGLATPASGLGVTLFALLTVLATARRRASPRGPGERGHKMLLRRRPGRLWRPDPWRRCARRIRAARIASMF
jgi:hypothetical protein